MLKKSCHFWSLLNLSIEILNGATTRDKKMIIKGPAGIEPMTFEEENGVKQKTKINNKKGSKSDLTNQNILLYHESGQIFAQKVFFSTGLIVLLLWTGWFCCKEVFNW